MLPKIVQALLVLTLTYFGSAATLHGIKSNGRLSHRSDESFVGPYGLNNTQCQQSFYEIYVNSTNIKFVGIDQSPQNQSYITSLVLQYTASQSNFTGRYFDGTFQLSQTFNISGTLCTPILGAKPDSAIQILVHGVGFDSSYWDFGYAPEYSYVKAAASYGYTTFRYDRLGTGLSETPTNGFDVAQASTEISILKAFVSVLRQKTAIGGRKWARVVGVGHSYGSIQTQAVSASDPNLYDAVILQGFSANSTNLINYLQSGTYSIARDTLPAHLLNKPPVWLVTGSVAAAQIGFYYYPYYDPGVFAFARDTEQPVSPGSLFTVANVDYPAIGFNKPTMLVFGDKDFIFSGSDAYAGSNGLTIPGEVQPLLYPNVTEFEVFIPANTGHAVNQHFSAPQSFSEMIQFLGRHEL